MPEVYTPKKIMDLSFLWRLQSKCVFPPKWVAFIWATGCYFCDSHSRRRGGVALNDVQRDANVTRSDNNQEYDVTDLVPQRNGLDHVKDVCCTGDVWWLWQGENSLPTLWKPEWWESSSCHSSTLSSATNLNTIWLFDMRHFPLMWAWRTSVSVSPANWTVFHF